MDQWHILFVIWRTSSWSTAVLKTKTFLCTLENFLTFNVNSWGVPKCEMVMIDIWTIWGCSWTLNELQLTPGSLEGTKQPAWTQPVMFYDAIDSFIVMAKIFKFIFSKANSGVKPLFSVQEHPTHSVCFIFLPHNDKILRWQYMQRGTKQCQKINEKDRKKNVVDPIKMISCSFALYRKVHLLLWLAQLIHCVTWGILVLCYCSKAAVQYVLKCCWQPHMHTHACTPTCDAYTRTHTTPCHPPLSSWSFIKRGFRQNEWG